MYTSQCTVVCDWQAPWSRDGLLQLMELVERYSGSGSTQPPILVHCVDGASQSGLFCACSIVCEKWSRDQQVDIFHTVKALKLTRYHFINTLVITRPDVYLLFHSTHVKTFDK